MGWSKYEEELFQQGYRLIAGVDEAGRGAIAGPVVVGIVIIPSHLQAFWLREVKDSKLLSPAKREKIFHHLVKDCWISIGLSTSQEIDRLGIGTATRLAIGWALEKLYPKPDFLLLDGLLSFPNPISQKTMVKGDRLCLSIACASILAKVTRDRIMEEQEKIYPGYGFTRHKGYATRQHLSSLSWLGPCPIHRFKFAPLRQ